MSKENVCDICEMISKKESFKVIYEDEDAISFLHEAPAHIGHTILVPKQHFMLVEEVLDEIFSMLSIWVFWYKLFAS